MKKNLFSIIAAFVALLIPLMLILSYNGLLDRRGKSDIAVVLGTTVYEDGTMAPFLKGRVDAALEGFKAGDFPLIMVSGGLGIEGHDEAQVMADYLMKNGVPKDAIIIDGEGINTDMTAQNLKEQMAARGLKNATIVTQYFHIPRTRLALACQGVDAPFSIHSRLFNIRDLYSTLREIPAYAFYWWRCQKG